jgi:hypothetical protein
MTSQMPAEFRSLIRWRAVERSDDHPSPLVLFFENDPPPELVESGLYVNYDDFMNVMGEVGTRPEPLANLFHALVLFFAQEDPRLYTQAEQQLRYNPYNQASWNRQAWTYKYWLLAEALQPYAPYHVTSEYKIPGVGKVGRTILRAVLFDELSIDEKLAQERDRFPN